MASRATAYWRSMVTRLGGSRSFAASTTHKMQPAHSAHHSYNKFSATGEFAPVYMVLGMMLVALTIGTHTAKQQLVHNPNVTVSKKKRRSMPEVEDPKHAASSSDKFLNKSFLRKVAHIQDSKPVIPDPSRPNPYTRARNVETPKI